MKSKRIKSFLMAVVMIATFLPLNSTQVQAATLQEAKIYFEGNELTATVVTGKTARIVKSVPPGYIDEKLIVSLENTPVQDGGITFVSEGKTVSRMSIDPHFNPEKGEIEENLDAHAIGEGIYAIQGQYAFIGDSGRLNWKDKDGTTQTGAVSLENATAVQVDSFCRIECIKGETETEAPQFQLYTPKDDDAPFQPTGVFQNYIGGEIATGDVTKDPAKQKEINIELSKSGVGVLEIKLMPTNMVYSVPSQDGSPAQRNNYVKENAVFDVYLELPRSTELMLTVLTPQSAINRVEQQIESSNGTSDISFISFEKGDTLSGINQNFRVRVESIQFGDANFKVDWEWKPTHVKNDNGEWEELGSDPDTSYQEVVKTGNENAGWQTMNIKPLEDDVKGTLEATVTYYDNTGRPLVTNTKDLPKKEIVVRGIGTPVNVTKVKTLTGYSTTPDEPPIDGDQLPTSSSIKMDAYREKIDNFTVKPVGPWQYELKLHMGAKNGTAQYATVEVSGDTDAVTLQTVTDGGQPVDYKPKDKILNPLVNDKGPKAGTVNLLINANPQPADSSQRRAKLTISFYLVGQSKPSSKTFTIDVTTQDSSPSKNSSLLSLDVLGLQGDGMFDKRETIPYPFDPDITSYTGPGRQIHLPYRFSGVVLAPVREDQRGNVPIKIQLIDTNTGLPPKGWEDPIEVSKGEKSKYIPIAEHQMFKFIVTVPAQDPRPEHTTIYTLEIVRDGPSEDNTLSSLEIYFPEDTSKKKNLIGKFDPNITDYNVEIPYSTKRLRVLADLNDTQAEGPVIFPELTSETVFGEKQWLSDLSKQFEINDPDHDGILDVTFKVTSESKAERIYTVHIHRLDPNDDATLKTLEVTDSADKKLTYKPAFKADINTYTMDIPYSVQKIKLNVTPNDPNVNDILIYDSRDGDGKIDNDKLLFSMSDGKVKPGALTSAFEVLPIDNDAILKIGYHSFTIRVIAENENTTRDYELRVQREEPSDDALLKSLVLKDQDGAQIKTFAFHPDETGYSLEVPYETNGISFTPTSSHPGATIYIKDGGILDGVMPYTVGSGMTSKVFKLGNPGDAKEFQVEVKAEDGTIKTYTITVTRGQPSSDAFLKALKVDNVDDFSPIFIASRTEYEAIVSEGAPGVIITATANHPGATIRIDGNVVASGQPSDLIELIEVEKKIEIWVTAQDGETQKCYTIEFTNQNLIEKTSNADLRRLRVEYGQMTPKFQPAVTEYEVVVTENTYSVDIIPKASDPLATVQVFSGSKEIGDYNGNYAQALEDGQNDITIKVTSPDKTVTKDYTLAIYRNEEDELKNLTPLEADDIDFENSDDVILVMIDEYPRVSASVFNELKEYPEKTIIFQGNDYSLKFKASDLKRVIPQTEIYDFRMSFTSPDEDAIYDLIDSRSRNDDIIDRAVMMYFWYHGSLPGPATFNLSLGSRYASDTLYWHYYNQERDRIDYYGSLKSNKKGTIAVTIDHFSTYILTPKHRIAGSENKNGIIDELGQVSDGSDNINSSDKVHPNTGAWGGRS